MFSVKLNQNRERSLNPYTGAHVTLNTACDDDLQTSTYIQHLCQFCQGEHTHQHGDVQPHSDGGNNFQQQLASYPTKLVRLYARDTNSLSISAKLPNMSSNPDTGTRYKYKELER